MLSRHNMQVDITSSNRDYVLCIYVHLHLFYCLCHVYYLWYTIVAKILLTFSYKHYYVRVHSLQHRTQINYTFRYLTSLSKLSL